MSGRPKPSAQGSGHKNWGPLIAAILGGVPSLGGAGAGDAAIAGDATGATTGGSVDAMMGGGIAQGAGAGSGEGVLSSGSRGTIPIPSSQGLSTKPNVNSITPPGWLERTFINPSSGAEYRNLMGSLMRQQMSGDQGIQQITTKGAVDKDVYGANAATDTAQQKQRAMNTAAVSYMTAHDIPATDENYSAVLKQVSDPAIAATLSGAQTQATRAGTAADFAKTPVAQEAQKLGIEGTDMSSVARNIGQSPVVGIGQNAFYKMPGFTFGNQGAMPTGTSSSSTTGFDPKTGQKTESSRSQSNFLPPSAYQLNLNPNIDTSLSAFNASQATNGVPSATAPNAPVSAQPPSNPTPPVISTKPQGPQTSFQGGLLTPSPITRNSLYQQAQGMGDASGGMSDALQNLFQYLIGKQVPNTNNISTH